MENCKIIVCRHAQSLEDIDNSIYDTISDLDIPLTEKGIEQAKTLGQTLSLLLRQTTKVIFFTSPGLRNKQTMHYIIPFLPVNLSYSIEIEPLIVKQDWGYITSQNRSTIEEDRYKIGVLRYKFPTGESAENMIKRIRTFRDKVFDIQNETNCNIVVFSHGFEFRIFLMTVLGWSEDYFETLANLDNCEYRILTKHNNKYLLDKPLKEHGKPITRLKHKTKKA